MNWVSRLACMAGLTLALNAPGADITLNPVADTSLIEASPNNNLGGQTYFTAGTTQNGPRTRGLLEFDFSSIPAGSTIQSVQLELEVVGQPSDGFDVNSFGLHRMLQPWGEGNKIAVNPSAPGLGAPASPGEATWNARLSGTSPWAAPGGQAGVDFVAASSAETLIYQAGLPYSLGSTPGMVADVQSWVDNPQSNFGWMLKGEDDSIRFSARRFGSHESAQDAPQLFVTFSTVPEPSSWVLFALGGAGMWWLRRKNDRHP